MERFAKVFETHGRQFLIKKGTSGDDMPQLSVIVVVEGAEIDMGFTFNEGRWEHLDKAFDDFGEEEVAVFGAQLEGADSALEVMKRLTK